MQLDHLGIAQIQRGWSAFIQANPGLKGCELKTVQQWNGEVHFEVKLGGQTHTHVYSPQDMDRHAGLRAFLVGLTDVSKQKGGEVTQPENPTVIASPLNGRRKLILDHG